MVFSHHNLLIYEIFLNYPGAGEIKARLLVLSVLSSHIRWLPHCLQLQLLRIRCLLLASTSTCTHEYIPHSHIIKNEKKKSTKEKSRPALAPTTEPRAQLSELVCRKCVSRQIMQRMPRALGENHLFCPPASASKVWDKLRMLTTLNQWKPEINSTKVLRNKNYCYDDKN